MKLFDGLFKRRRAAGIPQRVAIRTGSVVTEVGSGAILHAFFSTISSNLEQAGWGTRFPTTMNKLYQGSIAPTDSSAALNELLVIEKELLKIPTSNVVWDIENPAARPSPYYKPGRGATNAVDYFVTVNGLNLLRAGFIESVESALEFGDEVRIISFGTPGDLFRGVGRKLLARTKI
ncbi:Imm70 family immunity protein [Montanilutibacter psychrotolerans]|uniref:Uncharacterized protein n=1 Tax=Montanilutibacter psychrotolerans TaxID=1327343 RepID=A0A3M8SVA5_9GAMM|nr:Imm70 family immunity protein [Lysobacter psychrotolerans]RNF85278.1 hypothetical protein EER27_05810 [Lysobacter psychrotolerans]